MPKSHGHLPGEVGPASIGQAQSQGAKGIPWGQVTWSHQVSVLARGWTRPRLSQTWVVKCPHASHSLSLSFGFALGSILTAWFVVIPLRVTDLRKCVIVKRLSLYVNDAVTFSIHKVYIPINIIQIYYI